MTKLLPAVLITSCLMGCNERARPLSRKERAFFPPALAYSAGTGSQWNILLEGAVCKRSSATSHVSLIEDWLDVDEAIPDEASRMTLRERIGPFLDTHSSGRILMVEIGGQSFSAGPTDKKGMIEQNLTLDFPQGANTELPLRVRGAAEDLYAESTVRLIATEGVSVISDIDDTIRITECQKTTRMLKRNFTEAHYQPVVGMAELYQSWSGVSGTEFHYVSGGSYWLYLPMHDFLQQFPSGTLHLRVTHEPGLKGLFSSLDPPAQYKVERISKLIDVLPHRRFVLVGDSGEHDPEAYAQLAQKYPNQVRMILIRNITCESRECERYKTAFAHVPPALWQLYEQPTEIRDVLKMEAIVKVD
jgi:phosphatidate phosphatase APP1